ncbi:hypothetical protein Dsin_027369 [Dipteronia sinensis]|uniref:Uncharacterized protein n=1 Tax=Dipteronia sinensis TaxID=43782 RepID=A0AAE0DT91_9ROSI|nr:hypothetical protein Dsin_027369 [Dipteronia sinensis]
MNVRESGDFLLPACNSQICIIDPDNGLFGLHLNDGEFEICRFKVILPYDVDCGNLDGNKIFVKTYGIRPFLNIKVLDIKFLYGYQQPTIVVLYKDVADALHVKSISISLDRTEAGSSPWTTPIDLDYSADLLVPVKSPYEGFLIIGDRVIEYHYSYYFPLQPIRIDSPITKASTVGIIDEGYLLGDNAGSLYLVSFEIDDEGGRTLQVQFLGDTPSIITNISCLDGKIVFLGSSYGYSQLIKLNLLQPVGIEVLDSYVNLGPIVDFRVEGIKWRDQVVTGSGAYKDGSLHIIRNEVVINEQGSLELKELPVTGMWLLRASTDDVLLVVSLIVSTLFWKLEKTVEGTFGLDIIEIGGFDCKAETLFCHNVVKDQLLQTSYLLCGLRDGRLLKFLLTQATGQLTDREDVSLGKGEITVVTFSSKNTTYVFAVSNRSAVIYSSNGKLLYNDVDMKDIRRICPFNSVAFPDRYTSLHPAFRSCEYN